jgi:hypothetical protein
MEPVSAAVGAVLALVDWKKVAKDLAQDAAKKGAKTLLGRFRPDEREKAAKHAIELFVREFLSELEDKTPLSSAIPGYYDQLKRLIEDAAPDIAGWLQPETKEVDLGPVERMWGGLGLDPLPEEFDWSLVARNYAREIRKFVKSDPALRAQLDTALAEQSAAALERIAGPAPGFDLEKYRDYLRKKCEVLQLSAMHTSTYEHRIKLWNVFVPQSVRESAPVRELPRDLVRQLRREGHLATEPDEIEVERYRETFASSAVSPVLDVLGRDRLVIVLGDPGSGKTSLLKFLLLQWVTAEHGPLPVWIDVKEYARERTGLLRYCESSGFRLDAAELDKALKAGEAALYLDGLDEIFDGPVRGSVVEEIASLASRYPRARIVVTSRIIGYDPDRLRNAGFTHATLEDFDNLQVAEFISKWHEAAEQDLKERARLQRQLESALRESQAIRQLSGNPLLLTMMAILNRTQALPRDRVELYAQASRVLLYEWDARRSLPADTFARQEKEEVLRELAGVMQQSDGGLAGNLIERGRLIEVFRTFLVKLGVSDAYEKSTSLVRQLTERNFILSYAGADRFSFVHRTFLEYFCASWFVERFEKKQTLSLQQMKEDVFRPALDGRSVARSSAVDCRDAGREKGGGTDPLPHRPGRPERQARQFNAGCRMLERGSEPAGDRGDRRVVAPPVYGQGDPLRPAVLLRAGHGGQRGSAYANEGCEPDRIRLAIGQDPRLASRNRRERSRLDRAIRGRTGASARLAGRSWYTALAQGARSLRGRQRCPARGDPRVGPRLADGRRYATGA